MMLGVVMTNPIRVMLVDDHAVVRAGLELLVSGQADMTVVAQAGSVAEALRLVSTTDADVVVMDLSLPDGDGMIATEQVLRRCPGLKILGLSRHEDRAYIERMRAAGAVGYVPKQLVAEALLAAIRTVANGSTFFEAYEVAHEGKPQPPAPEHDVPTPTGEALTEAEEAVLRRLAEGYSQVEIATALGRTVDEIALMRAGGMQKLGLRSRIDLVRYAEAQGWLQGR